MMTTDTITPIDGAAVYWSTRGAMDLAALNGKLEALGLPPVKPPTPHATLVVALNAVRNKAESVRPAARHRNRLALVREPKDRRVAFRGDTWGHVRLVAEVDRHGNLSFEGATPDEERAVRDAYAAAAEKALHSNLRAGLAELIRVYLQGVALKPEGGLYWIPGGHIPLWRHLQIAVAEASGGNSALGIIAHDLGDPRNLASVRRALVSAVREGALSVERVLDKDAPTKSELLSKAKEAKALTARIREYEAILRTTLTPLIEAAERTEATAVLATCAAAGEEDDSAKAA